MIAVFHLAAASAHWVHVAGICLARVHVAEIGQYSSATHSNAFMTAAFMVFTALQSTS